MATNQQEPAPLTGSAAPPAEVDGAPAGEGAAPVVAEPPKKKEKVVCNKKKKGIILILIGCVFATSSSLHYWIQRVC